MNVDAGKHVWCEDCEQAADDMCAWHAHTLVDVVPADRSAESDLNVLVSLIRTFGLAEVLHKCVMQREIEPEDAAVLVRLGLVGQTSAEPVRNQCREPRVMLTRDDLLRGAEATEIDAIWIEQVERLEAEIERPKHLPDPRPTEAEALQDNMHLLREPHAMARLRSLGCFRPEPADG